ncbi:hypothetical protein BDZ89DRAFT_1203395 [Hymenopellis radicata]|nr:hypothetical protein BDZ89DRAFT_1203395 [Hymenopellis radicata]
MPAIQMPPRMRSWHSTNRCCSVCRQTALRVTVDDIWRDDDTLPNRGPTQSQADLEQGFVGRWLGGGVALRATAKRRQVHADCLLDDDEDCCLELRPPLNDHHDSSLRQRLPRASTTTSLDVHYYSTTTSAWLRPPRSISACSTTWPVTTVPCLPLTYYGRGLQATTCTATTRWRVRIIRDFLPTTTPLFMPASTTNLAMATSAQKRPLASIMTTTRTLTMMKDDDDSLPTSPRGRPFMPNDGSRLNDNQLLRLAS